MSESTIQNAPMPSDQKPQTTWCQTHEVLEPIRKVLKVERRSLMEGPWPREIAHAVTESKCRVTYVRRPR